MLRHRRIYPYPENARGVILYKGGIFLNAHSWWVNCFKLLCAALPVLLFARNEAGRDGGGFVVIDGEKYFKGEKNG